METQIKIYKQKPEPKTIVSDFTKQGFKVSTISLAACDHSEWLALVSTEKIMENKSNDNVRKPK